MAVQEMKMIVRSSEAVWEGDLKNGRGTMKVGKGAYEGPYSFNSRFGEGSGTNPEELAGAAHAGCYSMALSHGLSQAGHAPDWVCTTANVHLGKADGGFEIPKIELVTRAKVPGISEEEFHHQAETAKENCPISKLCRGAEITLDAQLEH
jgi:lipoyl-dependent peroxiredoxin